MINLPYLTIAITGADDDTYSASAQLPALPLAYFVTDPDSPSYRVLFPESLLDVPHAGDWIASWISSSSPLGKTVLAEVNEEDLFRLRLFENGRSVDEYIVQPGYADGRDLPPSGGDSTAIHAFFGIHDPQTIQDLADVLSASRYDDAFGFGLAKERHAEIAELIGVPPSSVGWGYDSLSRGILPEDTSSAALQLVSVEREGASSGMQLREYVLFVPADIESEARIAARFLPDVVSWDDDFLEEEQPVLGSLEQVRESILKNIPTSQKENQARGNWLTIMGSNNHRMDVDLAGRNTESMSREVHVYSLTDGGVIPEALFEQLCRNTPWKIWDYRTRRIIGNPPRS